MHHSSRSAFPCSKKGSQGGRGLFIVTKAIEKKYQYLAGRDDGVIIKTIMISRLVKKTSKPGDAGVSRQAYGPPGTHGSCITGMPLHIRVSRCVPPRPYALRRMARPIPEDIGWLRKSLVT